MAGGGRARRGARGLSPRSGGRRRRRSASPVRRRAGARAGGGSPGGGGSPPGLCDARCHGHWFTVQGPAEAGDGEGRDASAPRRPRTAAAAAPARRSLSRAGAAPGPALPERCRPHGESALAALRERELGSPRPGLSGWRRQLRGASRRADAGAVGRRERLRGRARGRCGSSAVPAVPSPPSSPRSAEAASQAAGGCVWQLRPFQRRWSRSP